MPFMDNLRRRRKRRRRRSVNHYRVSGSFLLFRIYHKEGRVGGEVNPLPPSSGRNTKSCLPKSASEQLWDTKKGRGRRGGVPVCAYLSPPLRRSISSPSHSFFFSGGKRGVGNCGDRERGEGSGGERTGGGKSSDSAGGGGGSQPIFFTFVVSKFSGKI